MALQMEVAVVSSFQLLSAFAAFAGMRPIILFLQIQWYEINLIRKVKKKIWTPTWCRYANYKYANEKVFNIIRKLQIKTTMRNSCIPIQFSRSVVSNSLPPHGLQHARPPCPSSTPRVYSNSCPLSWWCHPSISSSVVPFSSHLQSFPESGSFQMSQLFSSGGQSIGVSASTSVLPVKIQDWFPLGWTGWISLQSKGLSSLLQNHSSEVSILWHSALFIY